jgi:hypothetical protein
MDGIAYNMEESAYIEIKLEVQLYLYEFQIDINILAKRSGFDLRLKGLF